MSSAAKRTRSHAQDEQPAKKIKVDPKNDTEISNKTTILILNNDCLERVFHYLSRNDLLNLYETNSRLQFASKTTFARKFGRTQTIVTNLFFNRVNVRMLKRSVKLLHAFGHSITKLRINFKLEKVEYLLAAVADHCGKKIRELELLDISVRVKEPTSALYNTGLEKMVSFLRRLNEYFPNLVDLKLDYRNISKCCPYFHSLARSIPSLRSFRVVGPLLPTTSVNAFVDVNRQLENFSVTGEPNAREETSRSLYVTEEFIQYLSDSLPQLKSLKIYGVSIEKMPTLIEYPSRFVNLKQLSFGSLSRTYHPERGYLSFLGEGIEEMELFAFESFLSNFADTISRFKQLKRLILHFSCGKKTEMQWNEVIIWSNQGIRELMQRYDHLTEIVIHKYHPIRNYTSIRSWNRSVVMK